MALNLTPCVYPLIPVTVSYFGGRNGQGRGKLIAHGTCYIGGLAVTNSILGVVAALTGGLMGALLQNPVILTLVAFVLIFFAMLTKPPHPSGMNADKPNHSFTDRHSRALSNKA